MVVTATNGGRWVWYSTTARPGLVLLDWHGDRDPSSLRESSRRLHAGFLLVLRRSNLPALHAAVGCGPEVSPLCPAPPARTRLRSPAALRQGHLRGGRHGACLRGHHGPSATLGLPAAGVRGQRLLRRP